MKNLFLLSLLCGLMLPLFAQAPAGFSYQAVVRDANQDLVINAPVGMQISILSGSVSGPAVYEETHTPTTNDNGLATLQIGSGSVVSGDFEDIDWADGPYFLKSEADPAGGTNYSLSSTTELLSVPYALHANSAEEVTGTFSSYQSFGGLNSSTVDISSNWTPLGIGNKTITKEHDETILEVTLASRISGGTFGSGVLGVQFELRLDGNNGIGGRGVIRTTSTTEYVTFTRIFENLPAGTYDLTLEARASGGTGTATGLLVDSGGWGGTILVKETR